MSILSIDFETTSLVDLKRTGVHTYGEHPSTRVICVAWAFDNDPVQVVHLKGSTWFPHEIVAHVRKGLPVRAWNAGFEWVIWNTALKSMYPMLPTLLLSQMQDTMAAAAYWGLPMSLDKAGAALNLPVQKDKVGHALMMRMNKPRSHNPVTGVSSWWDLEDQTKVDALMSYCKDDVAVERMVSKAVPLLPEDEQKVWVLDQQINARGVTVDMDFVERLRKLALEAAADANTDLERITGGAVKSLNATGLACW